MAPTLWASAAFITDDLTKVPEKVSSLKSEVVVPIKETLASLKETDADLTSKTDKVVRAVKLLLAQAQAITETVNEVKTDLVLVRTEQGVCFSSSDPKTVEASDDLMDYIMSEENVSTPDPRRVGSSSTVVLSPSKRPSEESDPDESIMQCLF